MNCSSKLIEEKKRTQRDVSRQRAYRFSKIEYDLNRFEHFEAALRKLLPDDKPNQESDIRQLAKDCGF